MSSSFGSPAKLATRESTSNVAPSNNDEPQPHETTSSSSDSSSDRLITLSLGSLPGKKRSSGSFGSSTAPSHGSLLSLSSSFQTNESDTATPLYGTSTVPSVSLGSAPASSQSESHVSRLISMKKPRISIGHDVCTTEASFSTSSGSALDSVRTLSQGSMLSSNIDSAPQSSSEFSFPSPIAAQTSQASTIFSFPLPSLPQTSQASSSGFSFPSPFTQTSQASSSGFSFPSPFTQSSQASPSTSLFGREMNPVESVFGGGHGESSMEDQDDSASRQVENLVSISAIPDYMKYKSHEEYRWEAYQKSNTGNCFPTTSSSHTCSTCGLRNSSLQQQSSAFGLFHSGQSSTPFDRSKTFQTSFPSAQSSTPSLDRSNTIQASASSIGFGQTMFTSSPLTISLNNNGVRFNQTIACVIAFLPMNCPHCTATCHSRNGSNSFRGT